MVLDQNILVFGIELEYGLNAGPRVFDVIEVAPIIAELCDTLVVRVLTN